MNDDRFEKLLRKAAQEYNKPPPAPREAMWDRITARRKARPETVRWKRWQPRWIMWPVAAAAATVVVIFTLHYWESDFDTPVVSESSRGTIIDSLEMPRAPQPGITDKDEAAALYYLAATTYLTRTDAVLTQFRHSEPDEKNYDKITAWADKLLTETRLLLDSPAAEDTELRFLMQDLEFVLAQIVQLGLQQDDQQRYDKERKWIQDGMKNKDLLFKLRRNIPAGKSLTGV
jgi:hypothetical protein